MPASRSLTRSCSRMFALSLLAAGFVYATPAEYDSLSAFQAAIGPHSAVETFNGVTTEIVVPSPLTFTPGIFSFSAESAGFFNSDIGGGDLVLSTTNYADTIVLTMLSGNVYAIGGYFWNTDVDFGVVPGTVALKLDDGTTVNVDLNSSGPATFYGFVSDRPILSLAVTPSVADTFATINDLYLADAPVSDTPEPGTVFGAVIGLAALAFARRRRFARR